MKITITEKYNKQRLDRVLNELISEQSRSQIQKMILRGEIVVNGKVVPVHHFLKTGDTIEQVAVKAEERREATTEPSLVLEPTVLYEDADFLVLEKPSGLLVHPTEKNEPHTVSGWLQQRYPEIVTVGEHSYSPRLRSGEAGRAGIVHRLDREVSGVMLAARSQQAFNSLKEQFKQRMVKKEYTTICYGHLPEPKGRIELPIGRNRYGQFVAHPRRHRQKFNTDDKVAITDYEVLEYVKDYTVARIRILTGRTHQIRVHLSAIGHPILGDLTYKPKKQFIKFFSRRVKVIAVNRIFLHSTTIGFTDLAGQWKEFTSQLPDEMTTFINERKK